MKEEQQKKLEEDEKAPLTQMAAFETLTTNILSKYL
jgi:hypothetical protein